MKSGGESSGEDGLLLVLWRWCAADRGTGRRMVMLLEPSKGAKQDWQELVGSRYYR